MKILPETPENLKSEQWIVCSIIIYVLSEQILDATNFFILLETLFLLSSGFDADFAVANCAPNNMLPPLLDKIIGISHIFELG